MSMAFRLTKKIYSDNMHLSQQKQVSQMREENMKVRLFTPPECGVRISTDKGGVDVEYLHHGSDFSATFSGMHQGVVNSIQICPAHSNDQLFHEIELDLDDGVEISISPEILGFDAQKKAPLIIQAHRRVPDSLQVIHDKIYLTMSGEWKLWPEGYGPTPADALRIDLMSAAIAIAALKK